uniref:Putative secreted protein n=1 Tax=Ixodes ricinus TaxID=34613 RepID=A0A6B0UAM9_IXORI
MASSSALLGTSLLTTAASFDEAFFATMTNFAVSIFGVSSGANRSTSMVDSREVLPTQEMCPRSLMSKWVGNSMLSLWMLSTKAVTTFTGMGTPKLMPGYCRCR